MTKKNNSSSRLHQWLNNLWYSDNYLSLILLPFSIVFFVVSALRKIVYTKIPGLQVEFSVPIVVVGNITVGGSGKTPMVIHLANQFEHMGFKVGVTSRGYGRHSQELLTVSGTHSVSDVGDEPLLIFKNTQATILVGNDRKYNIRKLIDDYQCTLIICDDGLQDYRFKHDVEIIMIDGNRVFGNQRLLPAGPLRELVGRLKFSDFNVVTSRHLPDISADHMILKPIGARKLTNSAENFPLENWDGNKVHAIAGIANPDRFFNTLESYGITVVKHPMPDHYEYIGSDLNFGDELPVFMTEKDAVKCNHISQDNTWYVPVSVTLPDSFILRVHEKIKR